MAQRKAHPAFCVQDIDALARRLEEAAFPAVWDDALPDRRRFYTSDPFGNRIEFIREGDGFGQKDGRGAGAMAEAQGGS